MIVLCLLGTAQAIGLADLQGRQPGTPSRIRTPTRIGVESSGTTAKFNGQVDSATETVTQPDDATRAAFVESKGEASKDGEPVPPREGSEEAQASFEEGMEFEQ